MSLFEQIKKDWTQTEKDRDIDKLGILTTLISEIQRLEKVDQVDDEKVLKVIRKYNKGLNEMIVLTLPREGDLILIEKDIISSYLPSAMDGYELDAAIEKAIVDVSAETPRTWARS